LSKRHSNRPRARRPASDNKGARGAMGARKASNPRYTRVEQRNAPPTQGARRPKTGSSTHAGKRGTATPAMSSTLDGRAKRRRGRQHATTLGGVGATTATRIARRRRSPREPVCSARRSAQRLFPSASASPRQSSSTAGRRTPCVAQRLPLGVSAGWSHQ
jgi:hypothetical protein